MTEKQMTIEGAAAAAGETKTNGGNGNAETTESKAEGQAPPPTSQVLALRTPAAPIRVGERGIVLTTLDELWRFSKIVLVSGLAPASFKSVESVAIATQMGLELGMTPTMALQNIAVINGRPSVWGDMGLALVESSGLLEDFDEWYEAQGKRFDRLPLNPSDDVAAFCMSKRKGRSNPSIRSFTVGDAKLAELWGKAGPWRTYPGRMLRYRARWFNLRDNFAQVLRGVKGAEELVGSDVIESEVVGSEPIAMPARASETTAAASEVSQA